MIRRHHSLLLFLALSCAACFEDAPSSTDITATPDDQTFLGPAELITEDGDPFCTGSLSVTLQADGSLSGTGTCGDLSLHVSGWLDSADNIISSGLVTASSLAPPPDGGDLSGSLSGDLLDLTWSLEIPLPDEPPIDDDYLSYTGVVYGQARLSRNP